MSELGIDFFIPEELSKSDEPAYMAGALCVIHALGKRMEMLNNDGVTDKETDDAIREQFKIVVDQISEQLPEDIRKKNHGK
jgi:hypothetical protein